tara:strand:- start:37 stop:426 length:390 start_codon:yes stop_codon:yes gene_type:complete
MKKLIILSTFFLSSLTIQASYNDFDCYVKNFTVLSEESKGNKEFIEANLKKRFIIAILEQEVIVTSISDTFNSSTEKFNIFYKNELRKRIRAITDGMDKTLVINPTTREATISIQGEFYLNAWLLDCKR